MKITDKQIAAFHTVLTVGTATMAANVLRTSQPAITRSIKQLEDATRLTLFDRSRGRLDPTPDAVSLHREIEENFRGLDIIARAAENIRRANLGYLRIGCLPAFGQGFISRTLKEFRKKHPNISVAIRPLLAPELIKSVLQYETDLGIVAYEVDHPGLSTNLFTEVDEVAILPEGHRLAKKETVDLQDFLGERIILLDSADPYRSRLEQCLREHRIDISNSIETQASASACSLVAQGLGVSVVNPFTALDYVRQGLVMRRLSVSLTFATSLIVPESMARAGPTRKIVPFINRCRERDLVEIEKWLST